MDKREDVSAIFDDVVIVGAGVPYLTTEALLGQLEERAQNAASFAECQVILKGISTILGDLSSSPALPPYNQGKADAAGDIALHATIVRCGDEP